MRHEKRSEEAPDDPPFFEMFDGADGVAVGSLFGGTFVKLSPYLLLARGRYYFSGLFYYRDSMGMPLDIILDRLQRMADERGLPVNPGVTDFITKAGLAGWRHGAAESQIAEAFRDIWGREEGRRKVGEALAGNFVLMPEAAREVAS